MEILPPELRNTEQANRLYAFGCVTEMDIVQLIYRPHDLPTRISCITSNTRTPTSCGVGASHGAACNVVRASESPCCSGCSW